jgi:acetyl esterase
MAKIPTRAQLVKRGKMLLAFQTIISRSQLLFLSAKKRSLRKEIFIDTEFGKVRTLWYGFEDNTPSPVYFDLHGGGFILGGAGMDASMNLEIRRQVGCKIISIEYAKAPDFPFPVAINQVYAVVSHVFDNAEKYAIDATKMAIGGHSAGGNLAAVTCLKARKEGKFQFVGQVLDYPPLDLATGALEKPHPKGSVPPNMALVFNASYVDPTQAKDPYVSPVYADQADLEGLPPALFILAGRDSLHDEGLKYCGMLKAAGVETECHEYPNAPHGFTYKPSTDTTDALGKMSSFLARYFKSRGVK